MRERNGGNSRCSAATPPNPAGVVLVSETWIEINVPQLELVEMNRSGHPFWNTQETRPQSPVTQNLQIQMK